MLGYLKGAEALVLEVLGYGSMFSSWSVMSITTGLLLAWLPLPSSRSFQSDFWSIFLYVCCDLGHFGACDCIFLMVKGILSLIVFLLSKVGVICLFISWVNCLFANLANLEHIQGGLGLRLGSKAWSRIESKNSFDLSPSVSIVFFKNVGGDVFSSLQGRKPLSLQFLSCLYMWIFVRVITSKSIVTMLSGKINFRSPLQLCWAAIMLLAIFCNQISESSKEGGGSKYSCPKHIMMFPV